jgi:Putative adhesin
MKKMKIAGLVLLGLMITANSIAQSGSTETLTVPLSSPGKPYSLKVHLVSGSIKVVSYDGKDIIINVSPRDGEDEEGSKAVENGMKRISTHGSYEVTAKEADNNVTVNTGNPNKAIDLELKIPQDVKLQIGTVNDGEVVVENVRGELEVNNVNDKITLTNISGSVVANTVNGDVNVTFKTIDPKAPMAFSTLNGDVNVALPADTKANLKLKFDNGDVFSDFDIEIDKTPAKIDKTTEPGLYKIKKDDWVFGKINGGGPEMMMKNMQGNIYVKKATK